jgi:CelD/BcsL family acetyltransferase involved in cellulose biosynthesis
MCGTSCAESKASPSCVEAKASPSCVEAKASPSCVEAYASAAALPPDARSLLDTQNLFASRLWWDVVQAHAIPAGASPLFLAIRVAGCLAALVPLLRHGSRLGSLTTPYTCEYAPLLAPGLDPPARLAALGALACFCRQSAVTRLDAIPAEWPHLPDLRTAARHAGLRTLRFDHFGNWQETVATLDWQTYVATRPGALRETIRRRLRRAEQLPDAGFRLLSRPEQMDHAIEAYESIYRRSWKAPEPFPGFNPALIRATAANGQLRLGLWSIGPQPVAAQVWVVQQGRATVLKLAHNEAFKVHSPGTVLTAWMLRHLLDQEHVTTIDFGRGDDAYKQGWARHRRQRVGLLLVNPRHPAGAAALLRHAAGRLRTAVSRRGAVSAGER